VQALLEYIIASEVLIHLLDEQQPLVENRGAKQERVDPGAPRSRGEILGVRYHHEHRELQAVYGAGESKNLMKALIALNPFKNSRVAFDKPIRAAHEVAGIPARRLNACAKAFTAIV